MFNPRRSKDRLNLDKAIKLASDSLEPFRNARKELIEVYTGDLYGQGTRPRQLVNWLQLTTDVNVMSLAAERPRVLISTHHLELVPFARRFEAELNNLIEEIELERTLRRIVLDAYLSVGIAKVFMAPGKPVEFVNPEFPAEPGPWADEGQWAEYRHAQKTIPQNIFIDPGRPFVQRVSLDDFTFDVSKQHIEEAEFFVHEYRVPLELAKEDERFDKKARDRLISDSKHNRRKFTESRVQELSMSQDVDELQQMVTLRDIYLPMIGKWMVTDCEKDTAPLFYEDYEGPEEGPFDLLWFTEVPDNPMPAPPGARIKHLHDLMNSLMRKMAVQAKNQKNVYASRGDGRDAKTLMSARNETAVSVQDPEALKLYSTPGADQNTHGFYHTLENLHTQLAGNPVAMAGLGAQSDTATQDTLIHGAVSKVNAKMQYQVADFTRRVCKRLGHYLWHDQVRQSEVQITIPGLSMPIVEDWTPEEREGDFLQYNFRIDPYSMSYKSPQERMDQILNSMERALVPLGAQPDMAELIDLFAHLLDLPRLRQIFPGAANPMVPEGEPPKAPTHSTYERISRSGSTPQSHGNLMAKSLAGNASAQETSSLGVPVG